MNTARTSQVDGRGSTPRFCPRCRRGGHRGAALCPDCGETLLDQGYCPVCEADWPLRVGDACPKHEVDLEPGPAGHGPGPEAGPLVTVRRFARSGEAEAARLRLEAEGITTFLQGERMGNSSMYQVATGGVELQVPRTLADEARVLLSQTWSVPVADDDWDDAWEELAPEPVARWRATMKGLILLMLFGPLLLALLGLAFDRWSGQRP